MDARLLCVCVCHCEYIVNIINGTKSTLYWGGVGEGKRLTLVGLDARGELTSLNRIPERFWDPKVSSRHVLTDLCRFRHCLPNVLPLNIVALGDILSTFNLWRQTSSWLVCVFLDLWVYAAFVSGAENSPQSQLVDPNLALQSH